jgi:hypothetical protein
MARKEMLWEWLILLSVSMNYIFYNQWITDNETHGILYS